MAVYTLDPLQDPRWSRFVRTHPQSSPFHTVQWLEALRRTYGYTPEVYTTSPPEIELANGIVVCKVASWVTGRRLVSVPFADHCQPLVGRRADWESLFAALRAAVGPKWKYLELRPLESDVVEGLNPAASFRHHVLDIAPQPEEIFHRFHNSHIQRKIQRARREQLVITDGTALAQLRDFYALLVQTRRRHGVPPPSIGWFENLLGCFRDAATVSVARRGGRPVGAIFTILHGTTLLYKYGCSDARAHPLGVMPFLFWHAIQRGKAQGATVFDLGRCDLDNPGLAAFKERLGAASAPLIYFRVNGRPSPRVNARLSWLSKRVVASLPDPLLVAAGRLVYPHIA